MMKKWVNYPFNQNNLSFLFQRHLFSPTGMSHEITSKPQPSIQFPMDKTKSRPSRSEAVSLQYMSQ